MISEHGNGTANSIRGLALIAFGKRDNCLCFENLKFSSDYAALSKGNITLEKKPPILCVDHGTGRLDNIIKKMYRNPG